MYFSNFQNIYYDFKFGEGEDTQLRLIKDITTNVRVRKKLLSEMTIFDWYEMEEGDTPEIVASKVYGNPELHWVVMLANDRYDYVDDFPMNAHQLERHVDAKYGNQRNAVHHYEKDGYEVDPTVVLDAVAVSNADYEYQLNDKKRRIKLVRREVIGRLMSEFANLVLENSERNSGVGGF